MNRTLDASVNQYLKHCKNTGWVKDEIYKFEFANYINTHVNWEAQSDEEILEVLIESQKIKYTGATGIQFIQISGREKKGEFIGLRDVQSFRKVHQGASIKEVDWNYRNMSYTALSAWLASLFPDKFYPVPAKTVRDSILYLFKINSDQFHRVGLSYILTSQDYLRETESFLRDYPIEELFLPELNYFYQNSPDFNISPKERFEQIDWIWAVQDFHLFVQRNIIELNKKEVSKSDIQDEHIDEVVEGKSKLAIHKRYERNNSLVRKLKEKRLNNDPYLKCDVCNFTFLDTYGDIGKGFIEAHHLKPLSERDGEQVTKQNDISLVCSNCHNMLHKGSPVFSLDELKKIIIKQKIELSI